MVCNACQVSRNAIHGLLLVLVVWVTCLVPHYGGIRFVDAGIVFRAGEGWAAQGGLVVTNALEGWAGLHRAATGDNIAPIM